ncbi:NEAT domain-containing protein [uncultured Eubacterium sp.]|uniref:NEAT domain-containing protein n=1 Tax=uncultured Eubacterium sp. TaxID=165185 RepID=UPI00345DAC20
MSQEALEDTALKLHVAEDGTATLKLSFHSVHYLGQEGYLGSFAYFEGYHADYPNPLKEGYTATPATVLSRYEDFTDSFNDPVNGTDSNVKGQRYIHEVEMPIDITQSQFWVQVYVPVMESISVGGGTKEARLVLDWSTRKQIAGLDTDKTALKAAVTQLNTLKKSLTNSNSTDTARNLLYKAIAAGTYVSENLNVSQDMVDAMTTALASAAKIVTTDSIPVDRTALEAALTQAKTYLTQTDKYTTDTLNALTQAVQTAEAVYNDDAATQTDIITQCDLLNRAVQALQEKTQNDTTDIRNLSDGVYAITGKMVKTDKETASMSNEAINHTVKLTVKNGTYYITLDFKGLKIGTKYGYLSQLKYFKTGYTLDKFYAPQGDLADVTILDYQKNSDGSLASDQYGTNYPDQVQFPLIPEALDDGYVPLQVFVPVMEAIAADTGTQPVYLSLDWSTLRATTDSDSAFTDGDNSNNGSDNNGNNNNNNNNNGNGGTTGWIDGGLNQSLNQ